MKIKVFELKRLIRKTINEAGKHRMTPEEWDDFLADQADEASRSESFIDSMIASPEYKTWRKDFAVYRSPEEARREREAADLEARLSRFEKMMADIRGEEEEFRKASAEAKAERMRTNDDEFEIHLAPTGDDQDHYGDESKDSFFVPPLDLEDL